MNCSVLVESNFLKLQYEINNLDPINLLFD